MPTFHRWFILPMVEFTDPDTGETVNAPKYVYDEDRLDGFTSGGPFAPQQVEGTGYALLTATNDTDEWRVVVAWGEDNEAWQALNEIHAMHQDTATLADHGQDVAPVMDNRFGPGEWGVGAGVLVGSENNAQ